MLQINQDQNKPRDKFKSGGRGRPPNTSLKRLQLLSESPPLTILPETLAM
jgi:hypothetical protein